MTAASCPGARVHKRNNAPSSLSIAPPIIPQGARPWHRLRWGSHLPWILLAPSRSSELAQVRLLYQVRGLYQTREPAVNLSPRTHVNCDGTNCQACQRPQSSRWLAETHQCHEPGSTDQEIQSEQQETLFVFWRITDLKNRVSDWNASRSSSDSMRGSRPICAYSC